MTDETISGGSGFEGSRGGVAAPPREPGRTDDGRVGVYAANNGAHVAAPPTADDPTRRPLPDFSQPYVAPPQTDAQKKLEEQRAERDKPFYKKPKVIIPIIAGALLIAALAFGIPWYLNARQYQSTDDAIIDAHSERVAPQVAGRVLGVPVDDNQAVEAGQLLVQIDPSDYQAMLDKAEAELARARGMLDQARAQRTVNEANVEQAQAQVDVAQTDAQNAKNDLDRYSGLSKEAVSRQTLDNATSAYRSAQATLKSQETAVTAARAQVKFADSQIEADQASIQSAEADVEQARLQLSYTTVLARTAGRVTRKSVTVGDYVSAAQQLLAVVPTEVYVTANFKETELTDMRAGQAVDIEVDAFPDQKFTGKVQSIQSGTGAHFSLLPPENATGNYVKVVQRVPVKIVFDDVTSDAYHRLSPGMSVVPSVKVK